MTTIRCDGGVCLHVEQKGKGEPIIFAHEFGGDWRSWTHQFDAFSGDYNCIRYSARGFLPSDTPEDEALYGQERSTRDLFNVADGLGLERFHLVGLSMGSFTSLMAALSQPKRILSLTLAGCSSGPCGDEQRRCYRKDLESEIALLLAGGGDGAVQWFAEDPAYRRMPTKHPEKWSIYCENLRSQSVIGAINTLKTVHWNRVCLRDLEQKLRTLDTPALLVFGDEDHHLIEPTNHFLSTVMPQTTVMMLERTGHLVNLEEPAAFNAALRAHLVSAAQSGRSVVA